MVKLHDFLVEHAKFPFPPVGGIQRIVDTTDISDFEVGLLAGNWKAKHAVRDDSLIQKLCDSLQNILGNTTLLADHEQPLLRFFSPQLESDEIFGPDEEWLTNPSEAKSRSLLVMGVYRATARVLTLYGHHSFTILRENSVERGSSRVDYVLAVDNQGCALCDAKSPSVMHNIGERLPEYGFELTWRRGQTLIPKIFTKAALYLGLRQMEWLFLSCHNYWIVCRLVSDLSDPFLAFSPKISIEDSSEPFRAFLGAILSVRKGAHVVPSTFNRHMQFDPIMEDTDEGPLPEDDIDDINDNSGPYRGSSNSAAEPPTTRSRAERGLMITSSSPSSPEPFQVWVHLQALENNVLALPVSDGNGQQRLWLTRFIGSGSTGKVWECKFDHSNDLFAVKIVELLHPSDADSRQRLRNEFNAYLIIEAAYQSGRLRDRITPRCYGAFEGDGVDVIVLDLCDGDILDTWDKLSTSELAQAYKLVQDLHSIGIVHGDLEPQNVMRTPGGRLYLIDFSHSRNHNCKENTGGHPSTGRFDTVQNKICPELHELRGSLRERHPIQPHPVNL